MKEKNSTIYYIKGLAVLSVICAHCNAVLDAKNGFVKVCSLILQNIGTVGVICFFVISGMLFHYKEGKMIMFFKKRIFSICVPWFVSASCVYLYVYFRKPPLSFIGWINFLIGNGSYCYYLTMLMLCYFIFTFFSFMRTNLAFSICEIITFLSTIWFYQIGRISPYLNILNWIGYFGLGMQLAIHPEIVKKMLKKLYQLRKIILAIYVIIFGLQICAGNGGSYWKGVNVVISWLGAVVLILFAMIMEKYRDYCLSRIIYWSGKESFYIYLWHMPVAGIVARVMSYKKLTLFLLVRPIIVILIMIMAYIMLKCILRKLNLNQYYFIFGIER